MNKFIISIFCLFSAPFAFSASFDCKKASHPHEKMICGSQGLNQLDAEIGKLYQQQLSSLPEPQKAELKTAQRQWISDRTKQCSTLGGGLLNDENQGTCLAHSLGSRLEELRTWTKLCPHAPRQLQKKSSILIPREYYFDSNLFDHQCNAVLRTYRLNDWDNEEGGNKLFILEDLKTGQAKVLARIEPIHLGHSYMAYTPLAFTPEDRKIIFKGENYDCSAGCSYDRPGFRVYSTEGSNKPTEVVYTSVFIDQFGKVVTFEDCPNSLNDAETPVKDLLCKKVILTDLDRNKSRILAQEEGKVFSIGSIDEKKREYTTEEVNQRLYETCMNQQITDFNECIAPIKKSRTFSIPKE